MTEAINIIIKYATEADVLKLSLIEVLSFPSSRYLSNTFPNAELPTLQTFKAILLYEHLASAHAHVLAGVDPMINDLIAYSRWTIPREYGYEQDALTTLSDDALLKMADPLPYAPRPINKEIYKAYGAFIDRKRAVHITQHDMVLDMLCVLPDYQGKGIGTRFLKWGMDKADANNARIYLEATLEGYPLYLKYGWKVVEEFVLDYEKYGGAGSQKFVLMMREPQTGENM